VDFACLQEHADKHIRGMCVKVRDNDIGLLPRARPVWLFNTKWYPKGTYRRESCIEEERIRIL
jgi:hypothetical protein